MKFYFILPFLLVFSCKKKSSNFIVRGVITDATLNKGLPGAKMSIYKIKSGSSYETFIASSSTDSNGSYSFEFERDKTEKYIIKFSKDLYYSTVETITVASLSIEKENERNYETTAKSWIKLQFKNNDPNTNDEFKFLKGKEKIENNQYSIPTYQYLYGATDTSFYSIIEANTEYSVLYSLKGTNFQGVKTISSIPFDTTELFVEY